MRLGIFMSRKSLTPYIKLVDFLGEVLGPDYEIVLQDVRNKTHAIVAIKNGHISERSVGAPLTDFALKMVADKEYLNSEYYVSYNGMSKNNKLLRSSTLFIMDEDELIGLLCINFDSSRYLDVSKQILRLCHPDSVVEKNYNFTPIAAMLDVTETFSGSIAELTDSIIESTFPGENISPSRLSKEEKLQIVGALNQKGAFMIKGAVSQVAAQLCCSQASIYRYLNKIHEEELPKIEE